MVRLHYCCDICGTMAGIHNVVDERFVPLCGDCLEWLESEIKKIFDRSSRTTAEKIREYWRVHDNQD